MGGAGDRARPPLFAWIPWRLVGASNVAATVGAARSGIGTHDARHGGSARFRGLFAAFLSLDQPLDPHAHIAFHQGREAGLIAMVGAMRAASNPDDLRARLAEVPVSTGGTWGDHLSEEELAAEAYALAAHDPEIFATWVDHSLEEFTLVPGLQVGPGGNRNAILFIDGDPDAGSMVTKAAAAYNLDRYPWAQRIQLGCDRRDPIQRSKSKWPQ